MSFAFTPTNGLKDEGTFPSKPVSGAAARKQVQDVLDQVKDYINNNLANKPVLLWTNGSPASSFSAQTISIDLSTYSQVEIVTYLNHVAAYTSLTIPVGLLGVINTLYQDVNWDYIMTTRPANVQTTGVVFSAAYSASLSSTGTVTHTAVDNTKAIPYKIYGLK